jgi:thiol-disulfide isomerase/thioredoxin
MALAQKFINDSAANIAVALTALAPGYDPIYNDQEFWNRFFTHVQSGGKLRIDPVKPRLLAPLVERFPNTLMAKTWIQYSDYDTLISPSALASIAAATMSGNDIDEMLLIAKAYGFRKGKIYDPKRALQFCNRAEDCMKAHTGFTSGEDIYANMGRDGKLYEQKILSLGENGYMHEAYVTAKRGLLLCSRQYDKQLIENAIAQAYLAHGDIEDAERAFGIALSHSTRNDLYGMQELYPLAKKGGETFGEFSKRLKNTYGTTLSLPAIPNFKYKTLEGVEGSLAGLRGKVVVIDCWFTSCAGCIVEKKSLNRLVDSFNGDTNVVFLSIALNDPAEVKRFLQQTESKFQVIPYGMPICTKIGVAGYPTHIIIDKAGATLGFELGGSTTVGEGMRPKILEALSLQP